VICDSDLFQHPVPDISAGRQCFREGRDWLWLSCRLSSNAWTRFALVLAGADVTEVAVSIVVRRPTIHRLGGLVSE
jgi:hypothetical protein